MQIIKDIEQGTQEWLNARAGLMSSSSADVILTPTGKPTTGKKVSDYMNKLVAERLMNKSADSGFQSDAMRRGNELEEEARSWYEMATGLNVEEVGIVKSGEFSCSPDGLIFDNESIVKGLEIKCPLAHTHVGYLKDRKLPTKYIPQIQSSIFVCNVLEWDFLSYHPDIEPMIINVKADYNWIEAYKKSGLEFAKGINKTIEQIKGQQESQ